MKRFAKILSVSSLMLVLLFSSLTVGAASTAKELTQKEINNLVDTDLYKNYHQGHMNNIDNTLTEEEYRLEADKYREENRKLLKEELNNDVKKGILTQEEADRYLNDFDTMAGYCGSHMMGYHHGNQQGYYNYGNRRNNSTASRRGGYGSCCH